MRSLDSFKQITKIEQITAFIVNNKIDWYVLRPVEVVAWPASLTGTQAFQCEDVRVYQFSAKRDRLIGKGK
jgi:hypothetical protein